MSAQMSFSIQLSFESEQARLAADGAFWAIRSLISNKDPQSQLGSDQRARPKHLSHGGSQG
jgi:hypothetical protein